jgi:hypothetical protein
MEQYESLWFWWFATAIYDQNQGLLMNQQPNWALTDWETRLQSSCKLVQFSLVAGLLPVAWTRPSNTMLKHTATTAPAFTATPTLKHLTSASPHLSILFVLLLTIYPLQ